MKNVNNPLNLHVVDKIENLPPGGRRQENKKASASVLCYFFWAEKKKKLSKKRKTVIFKYIFKTFNTRDYFSVIYYLIF